MAGGWHPWRELRRRRHIVLAWANLGGQGGRIDDLPNGLRQITLDPALTQIERNAALAHELVHDERGILFTRSTPAALVEREERWVRAETARRLVPIDLLEDFVRWRVIDHGCCEWRDVADEFAVPRDVAELAMTMLRHGARARHPSSRGTPLSAG